MHHESTQQEVCVARHPVASQQRERGVRAVVALTAAMMLLEITVGYLTGSMALLADGWHMATHVGALGLASLAYVVSRRYASHPAFAFGTGKVQALAGYTSAVGLGLVSLLMVVESAQRLVSPEEIDFAGSLPVAVLGFVVNVLSVWLLHGHGGDEHGHGAHAHAHAHEDEHDHDHDHDHELEHGRGRARLGEHDHNHRAALMHVVADTLTSALAIGALVAGRWWGLGWLDALCGIVGGVVIAQWAVGLCRAASRDLLDVNASTVIEERARQLLEQVDDVVVSDLHVWSLGAGRTGCVVTLITSQPREPHYYRERLRELELEHLTVEVQRCPHHHEQAALAGSLR